MVGPVVTDSDLEEVRLRLADGLFCCRASEFFLLIEVVPDTFLVLAGGLIGCGKSVLFSSTGLSAFEGPLPVEESGLGWVHRW